MSSFFRAALNQFQSRPIVSHGLLTPLSPLLLSKSMPAVPIRSHSVRFSAMTGLQSAAAQASTLQKYDPEIKDIAEYVHTYNINSDLAVRFTYTSKKTLNLTLC